MKESSPSLPFGSLASAYDDWFEGRGRLIFATELKALQEVLPCLPKPWLEVGVGSGQFARALGIEVALDPSAELLALARKRGIPVIRGRGEDLPIAGGTIGAVFLIVALCFVSSPQAVLQEAHRVLKPEGKLVLGMVLAESPWGRFYQERKKREDLFYREATFYRYPEVLGLLKGAGFSLERVLSTLFQLPNRVKQEEPPREGYSPEAGFTVIVAGKPLRS